jgi:hypothetical protein
MKLPVMQSCITCITCAFPVDLKPDIYCPPVQGKVPKHASNACRKVMGK